MTTRTRRSSEVSFGSDSFLDIVANIVGILIILTVIVGVKVKNAPAIDPVGLREARERAELEQRRNLQQWQEEKKRIELENSLRSVESERLLQERAEELARREERRRQLQEEQRRADQQLADRLADIEDRKNLLRRYQQEAVTLWQEVSRLQEDLLNRQRDLESRKIQHDRLQSELASKSAELERLRTKVQAENFSLLESQELRQKVQGQIAQIRALIEKIKNLPRQSKDWIHYALPISERVQQEEIHYRCLNDRIASTHLRNLLERLRSKSGGSDFRQTPIVHDSVGPIGGFRLRYEMARVVRSLSEQVYDPFSYQVRLNRWELVAESANLGETQEAALAEGSEFLGSLQSRPPRLYAVTLWVYADSFELAKVVESDLHRRGYTVALRPLIHGMPIAGSPWGSRSRGQ